MVLKTKVREIQVDKIVETRVKDHTAPCFLEILTLESGTKVQVTPTGRDSQPGDFLASDPLLGFFVVPKDELNAVFEA